MSFTYWTNTPLIFARRAGASAALIVQFGTTRSTDRALDGMEEPLVVVWQSGEAMWAARPE